MNKDFEKTVISSTAVAGGAMLGKVLSAKIPGDKIPGGNKGKQAALLALAIAGIYSLDRKDSTKALGLDVCIGLASSQMVALAASLLGDKAKELGLAGTYFDEDDVIYLDDYSLNGLSDEDLSLEGDYDDDYMYDDEGIYDEDIVLNEGNTFMSGDADVDAIDFM